MYCLSKAKLMQCLFKLNLVNAIMALLRGFVSMWYRVIYLKRDMMIMYNILHAYAFDFGIYENWFCEIFTTASAR